MINNDRIVPIMKMDLLSMIGTTLTLNGTSYAVLKATNTEGAFSVTGTGAAGNFLCDQPVKGLDIPAAVTGCTLYFVASYDFTGLTVAGATPTFNSSYLKNDDIVTDGATLYKAVLSSGTVTLTAVTPVVP